jgi:hypothetical protein
LERSPFSSLFAKKLVSQRGDRKSAKNKSRRMFFRPVADTRVSSKTAKTPITAAIKKTGAQRSNLSLLSYSRATFPPNYAGLSAA